MKNKIKTKTMKHFEFIKPYRYFTVGTQIGVSSKRITSHHVLLGKLDLNKEGEFQGLAIPLTHLEQYQFPESTRVKKPLKNILAKNKKNKKTKGEKGEKVK